MWYPTWVRVQENNINCTYVHPYLQGSSVKAVPPWLLEGCSFRLRRLDLSGSGQHLDATALSALLPHCPHLERLALGRCQALLDLRPLATSACVATLVELDVGGCASVASLAPLRACPRLRRLGARACAALQDLAPLLSCLQLRDLDVGACTGLQGLAPLTQLSRLLIGGCTQLIGLGPLSGCVRLEHLDLTMCVGVQDLSALTSMEQLQILFMTGCR